MVFFTTITSQYIIMRDMHKHVGIQLNEHTEAEAAVVTVAVCTNKLLSFCSISIIIFLWLLFIKHCVF